MAHSEKYNKMSYNEKVRQLTARQIMLDREWCGGGERRTDYELFVHMRLLASIPPDYERSRTFEVIASLMPTASMLNASGGRMENGNGGSVEFIMDVTRARCYWHNHLRLHIDTKIIRDVQL